MTAVLFIDSNIYLDFYGLGQKKFLDLIEERKEYIFVSSQIVDEISRRKLSVAEEFFSQNMRKFLIQAAIPEHLYGIEQAERDEFKDLVRKIKKVAAKVEKQQAETLLQISRSEDGVSQKLKWLSHRCVSPTKDELRRARDRKERGNPPGKRSDTLGDQITWEQLLTYCNKTKCKALWIVTKDSDYFTETNKTLILNSFLRKDIEQACGNKIELYCFGDAGGVNHFVNNSGVEANKLPTEDEAKEIERGIKEFLGKSRDFDIGDKIEFMHRPGRVASVTKFWDPDKAAKEFPSGVMGAKGPPYIDGVVEASFVELDAFGREYPKEIAAGTSVAGRRRWVRWGWLVRD